MIKKNKLRPFIKNINKWNIKNNFNLKLNKSGLVTCNFSFLKKNQIESVRKIISKYLKQFYKKPKFTILLDFKTAITKKSLGARMGRGKGSISNFICKLHKNHILFEFDSLPYKMLNTILIKIKNKLPIKLKPIILYKNGYCRHKDKFFR